MIFIKAEGGKAKLIHYKPFDSKHGLHKTSEELLLEGILVEELPPMPEISDGKMTQLYINPLRWMLEDKPLTQEEKILKMVDDGILTQEQANELLK